MKTSKKEKKVTLPKVSHKESNPALHALYVGWAVHHLIMIEESIQKFGNTGNFNMARFADVIIEEKKKLIEENDAYEDAVKIVESIKPYITLYQVEE